MFRVLPIILIPALLSIVAPALAELRDDGNEFLFYCEGTEADYGSGVCLGYLQGMGDMDQMYRRATGRRYFCVPDGVTLDQIQRVVVKYLKDHPEKLHEYRAGLVMQAIREAFPCKRQ